MDRERIFKVLENDVDKIAIAHGLDCAELAAEKNMIKETHFLDPYHVDILKRATNGLFGVRTLIDGGYPESERKKLVFYPDYFVKEDIEVDIAYVDISGANLSKCSHRDYLGSILGLGLKREKIGDMIVTEEGCQAIVSKDVLSFILSNLNKVGSNDVTVTEIFPHELKVAPTKVKEVNGTVASLRLDAVASLGFGISRTKIGTLVKSEKVKVQYKTITNSSYNINQGDIISIRGRGRMEVSEVGKLTKKNRIHLNVKKYL